MFKMYKCKDIAKIVSEERKLSILEKFNYKLHVMICHNCQQFSSRISVVKESFKDLVNEKTKKNSDKIESIEKEIIEKFKK